MSSGVGPRRAGVANGSQNRASVEREGGRTGTRTGCGDSVTGEEWSDGCGEAGWLSHPKPSRGLARIACRTRTEVTMLRTIIGIGALALLGVFGLKVFFGLFGVLFGVFFVLLGWAVRIAIVGGLIYLVLRLLMPDVAKKIEEK